MEEKQLDTLEPALQSSPDNASLLHVVMDACIANQDIIRAERVIAAAAIAGIKPTAGTLRFLAALMLQDGHADQCLKMCEGDPSGEAQLLRVRALLALDRRNEAADNYRAAVTANPTL